MKGDKWGGISYFSDNRTIEQLFGFSNMRSSQTLCDVLRNIKRDSPAVPILLIRDLIDRYQEDKAETDDDYELGMLWDTLITNLNNLSQAYA